jgi:23S rRNA pseudouridine2605 synthase
VHTRLQKILSHAGIASRRAAEELIRQGRVEVNRQVVTELGTKADVERDEIRVDGRRIGKQAPVRRHLLMFKPRGVVSTRSDPQRRTTVIDLLSQAGIHGYFYPVGRLDYDSEGLIILTNDGAFAERVSHPRHELERAYEARVLGEPDARDLARLAGGVVLDGRRTLPARVTLRGSQPAGGSMHTVLEIVVREGRNRQIRRMCDAIGHPIVALRRTRIGSIGLRGLKPGEIREMSEAEVRGLVSGPTSSPGPAHRRSPLSTDRSARGSSNRTARRARR